ncbi:MAG: PrsW family intramembrane metalloprotease [Actinobacteria bacterium]|jgi:RsiW-degrading membrane proteinase PrsW (M82 family)|nr:PrsW family intramembrane metalloprotease [Actinomycetota bacterium]
MNGSASDTSLGVTASPRLTHQFAFWLFIMLLAGSMMVVGLEQMAYLGLYPGAWLLSVVLLAATAVPAGLIIYRFDQFEPEPVSMIAIALIWGGVIALTFASVANSAMLSFLQHVMPALTVDSWGAAIVAPVNEELYKGAGLVLMYLMARAEFDGLMDGLIYGAMIGLGFQVVENIQYFMLAASESAGGEIGAVVSMYFLRVVLSGLYSHVLFSGLMGFGFAYFVTRKGQEPLTKRLGVFALFAAASWAAHFVWNSPWLESLTGGDAASLTLGIIIKGLPFLVFLAILAMFARRREGKAFARLMAGEVGTDTVTKEEFQILRSGRRRRRMLRQVRSARGPVARAILKRLMREQMNLALFHGKVESADHPALEAQRNVVRGLRAQLNALS